MSLGPIIVEIRGPLLVAAIRRNVHRGEIGDAIRSSGVWDLIRAQDVPTAGHNVVIYWLEPGRDLFDTAEGLPIDIGADALGPFLPVAPLTSVETPAGRVVTITHTGDYSRLNEAYAALDAHCAENGLRPAGPSWEIYGHWTPDPEDLETEVVQLLLD